mgnify:CR=1 FL=1|tara:strand:- start:25 stop:2346 length:2322 start_codon:yes stop_codon:yes gene_type:complete
MPTLDAQIEDVVGTIPSGIDTDTLLADGCKDIIRRISLTTPEDLWMFTTNSTVPTAGLTLGTSKIYDVTRDNKPCTPIQAQKRHRAAESDSIHYATAEFPVYYLLNGKVFVLPSPGTTDDYSVSLFASYDNGARTQITTTANTFAKGDYITIEQEDTENQNTYYVGRYRIYYVIDNTNFIIDRNYAAAATTGYTCTLPTAAADYIPNHTVDADDSVNPGIISNFPQNYVPLVVLYGAMGVLLNKTAELHDSFPSLVLPAAPIVPDIDVASATLPTYEGPASFVTPVSPSNVDIDFSGITPPAYSDIVSPTMESLNFSVSSITIDAVQLNVELPVAPSIEDFNNGEVDFSSIVRGKAPAYVKPVLTIPQFPNIPNLESPQPPPVPSLLAFDRGAITEANNNIPNYPAPVMPPIDFASVDTSILVDEDPELAGVKLNKVQSQIAEFQARSADAMNVWQEEMSIYKAKIEQAVTTASNTLSSENSEVQAMLTKYQAELTSYQSEAQAKVSDWTKNNIEHKYTKWVAEWQNALGQYQSEITNELNVFQKENAEYQAEMQKAITDSSNRLSSDNNKASTALNKYSAEVAAYQAKTQVAVNEWQQRVAQVALQEFTQKRADELAEWTAINSNKIQQYGSDITSSKSKFDSEFQIYAQKINQAIQTYSAETGYDLQKYQADVQAASQAFTTEAQKRIEDFKSNLERYSADIAAVGQKNADKLNKYQQELSMYQAESGNVVNKYSAKVQSSQAEMQWLLDRYATVSAKYETGFLAQPKNEQ